MDSYSEYNQIHMHPLEKIKTIFIIDEGSFYYRVMPFELNAGVYVDDMVAKSIQDEQHCEVLTRIFDVLRKHKLNLNPEKCSFSIQARKFLGYILNKRGIEVNPDKCKVVINMRSTKNVKEV
ncbi:hypothetical protein CR513_43019, partial [Mucuna pruriens]